MNPMLECLALAIYDTYEDRPKYAQGQMNGLLAEELARAVLQSLRDPTPAVIEAGTRALQTVSDAEAVWQAMLNTILEGEA